MVKLESYTKPVGNYTMEEFIIHCARVSNPENQDNNETALGLINYLINHKHWSPFEMGSVCLKIETTRDIGRQLLRHRSFQFQEFSQRYASPSFIAEPREARLQDIKNRQNSIEIDNPSLQQEWVDTQQYIIDMTKKAYEWALYNNIAKECARGVLPEGLTKTVIYMNGTIRSWIHFLDIRLASDTQKEHRSIAKEAAIELSAVCPTIFSKYFT